MNYQRIRSVPRAVRASQEHWRLYSRRIAGPRAGSAGRRRRHHRRVRRSPAGAPGGCDGGTNSSHVQKSARSGDRRMARQAQRNGEKSRNTPLGAALRWESPASWTRISGYFAGGRRGQGAGDGGRSAGDQARAPRTGRQVKPALVGSKCAAHLADRVLPQCGVSARSLDEGLGAGGVGVPVVIRFAPPRDGVVETAACLLFSGGPGQVAEGFALLEDRPPAEGATSPLPRIDPRPARAPISSRRRRCAAPARLDR